MGFLDKLWDEALAGPTPDAGLGKLRKFNSFSLPITRTILDDVVFRTRSLSSSSYPPPSGSSTHRTPSTRTSRAKSGDFKKLGRTKSSSRSPERDEASNPTVYYWVMMAALDR